MWPVILVAGYFLLPAHHSPPARAANIKVTANAQVLNITAWGFNLPDPHVKGEKVDVYSVTLRNPTKPSSGLYQVSFPLDSRPKIAPVVMAVSSGFYWPVFGPAWVVNLAPGHKTTVFFVMRSLNIKQYCAGIKPHKCTPRP